MNYWRVLFHLCFFDGTVFQKLRHSTHQNTLPQTRQYDVLTIVAFQSDSSFIVDVSQNATYRTRSNALIYSSYRKQTQYYIDWSVTWLSCSTRSYRDLACRILSRSIWSTYENQSVRRGIGEVDPQSTLAYWYQSIVYPRSAQKKALDG